MLPVSLWIEACGCSWMCDLYLLPADRVRTQRYWRPVQEMEMWFFSCGEIQAYPALLSAQKRVRGAFEPTNEAIKWQWCKNA